MSESLCLPMNSLLLVFHASLILNYALRQRMSKYRKGRNRMPFVDNILLFKKTPKETANIKTYK